jgi:hypothetical protein
MNHLIFLLAGASSIFAAPIPQPDLDQTTGSSGGESRDDPVPVNPSCNGFDEDLCSPWPN